MTTQYPPTASEYAMQLNARDGGQLVSDQAYWDKLGVHTGEDLARSLAISLYSDTYKDIHGIRPRGMSFSSMSVEEIELAADELYQNYKDVDFDYEFHTAPGEISSHQAYNQYDDPLGSLEHEKYYDPTDDMPKHSSFRRRLESTLRGFVRNILIENETYHRCTDEELDEMMEASIDLDHVLWNEANDYYNNENWDDHLYCIDEIVDAIISRNNLDPNDSHVRDCLTTMINDRM